MSTGNNDNVWIELVQFPKKWRFKYTAKIDNKYLLVVGNGGIYNYNLQTNKWNIRVILDNNSNYKLCAAALNNQLLYLSDQNAYVTTINLSDKTVKKLAKHPHEIGYHSTGFIINDEYHIIGGKHNNEHLKWNSTLYQWEKLYAFPEFQAMDFDGNQVVTVKSKQKAFMFGGYRGAYPVKHFDDIYEYDSQKNIWNKMSIKMPKACYVGMPVPVIRGQFILFFGWYNHDAGDQDDIRIFSVSEQKFKISSIKCPSKSPYTAVAINDCKRDEKIVFGYVRKQWKLSPIPDHWFPPLYLLKLMARYFLIECIHILDEGYGNHWKINSLDIV
eukprot:224743_1